MFITGAGVSAASGLPTYRGVGGLYRGQEDHDLPVERILSASVFSVQPELTWKHIGIVEQACRGAKPNRAHEIIAALDTPRREVWVVTQNVDGLHAKAGSRHLIEIHGNLYTLRCVHGDWSEAVPDYAKLSLPPLCPRCGAMTRPDVVLFEEMLPEAALEMMQHQLSLGFDAVFTVGTSALFPYVSQPVLRAASEGKLTVEINPGETTLSSSVEHHLPWGAVEALERIWAKLPHEL